MAKNRHIAPPIYLATALSLPIEVTVFNGTSSYTTTGVNSPYLSIPAGSYSWGDFVDYVAQQLAQYIFNDFGAAGSSPTNTGTVDNKNITLTFTASNTYNASLLAFSFSDPACRIAGIVCSITGVTLKAG